MNRITKGMHGTLAEPKEGLFGISSGRIVMSQSEACHEESWYNIDGEKSGEGSLAFSDLRTIANGLFPDELFITARLPQDIRMLRHLGFTKESRDSETLNMNGLECYATCVVSQGVIHVPRNNTILAERLRAEGIPFNLISRHALRHLIAKTRSANITEN